MNVYITMWIIGFVFYFVRGRFLLPLNGHTFGPRKLSWLWLHLPARSLALIQLIPGQLDIEIVCWTSSCVLLLGTCLLSFYLTCFLLRFRTVIYSSRLMGPVFFASCDDAPDAVYGIRGKYKRERERPSYICWERCSRINCSGYCTFCIRPLCVFIANSNHPWASSSGISCSFRQRGKRTAAAAL